MDITYSGTLPQELIAQTERLSPNRRREVENALVYNLDSNFENLLRNLDGDPETVALLLDPAIRERILLETAGKGYRALESSRSSITGNLGQSSLVPDSPIYFGGAEQDLLDLYSLQRELDYEQTGNIVKRDRNNAVHTILQRGVEGQGKGGTMSTARGGIYGIADKKYGTRNKHPKLPALSYETALDSTVNQLVDNLLGNERGEQPAGMMNKKGFMQSIPVEHKLAFNQYPHLGYDSNNRMMGSTSKNSVVRDEQNPIRRQVLLMSGIAKKEQDIVDKYGKTASQLANEMNYHYQPLDKTRMAVEGLPPSIQRLVSDRSGAVQQADRINDSQGQIIGQRPVVFNIDKDSKVFVHTNGNGDGKKHAEVQRAFNEANGSSGKPRRRG